MDLLYEQLFSSIGTYGDQLRLITSEGGRQSFLFYSIYTTSTNANYMGYFDILINEDLSSNQ
jgi:hypothetical protein